MVQEMVHQQWLWLQFHGGYRINSQKDMSILNVNKINPVGGGSTITIAGIASVTRIIFLLVIQSLQMSFMEIKT